MVINIKSALSKWVRCLDCYGTGVILRGWNSLAKCTACQGRGWVKENE